MIYLNGIERVVAAQTVFDLVDEIGLTSRGIAVALDGEIISRSAWSVTKIMEGVHVEIVSAAAGG